MYNSGRVSPKLGKKLTLIGRNYNVKGSLWAIEIPEKFIPQVLPTGSLMGQVVYEDINAANYSRVA
jgi:hypothetical protein